MFQSAILYIQRNLRWGVLSIHSKSKFFLPNSFCAISQFCFASLVLYFNGDETVLAKSLPSGVLAVPIPVKLSEAKEPSFKTDFTYPFY